MKRGTFKSKLNKPLKRTPLRQTTRRKTKKQSEASLWREYMLTKPPNPRYKGRKGIYWYLLSLLTRKRDFRQYRRCIACNREVESYQEFDAGHYAPADNCGFALLFHKLNINGECKGCNAFDSGHLIGYENNLRNRYGDEAVDELIQTYLDRHKTVTKEWTQCEYDTNIKALQAELKAYD